jgi:hypothetical protein
MDLQYLLFGAQKIHFRNEPLKNVFNKLILDFSSGSKCTWKWSQGKNRLPQVCILYCISNVWVMVHLHLQLLLLAIVQEKGALDSITRFWCPFYDFIG